MNIVIPAKMKGIYDLSFIILIARTGGQPIGEVLRIIKPTVKAAVRMIMFLSNLFVTFKK